MSFHWIAPLSLLAAVATAADAPFAKTGVAFLEKHCVSCHGPKKQKGDLALHEFRDDASLLKSRKKWKAIMEAVHSGEMPPDDEPQPSAEARAAFIASARAVFANYDRNAKPDPGRITLRRLNRAEYNNTIRDLTGIDSRIANDFPSDDVGYGFDNIGDVLTVSPVLMERYLDAAQLIAEQAIPIEPPKPSVKSMNARYTEPAGPVVPMRGKWRPFTFGKDGIESGPLHTPFKAIPSAAYTIRARVWAESPDGKPVKAALFVSGEQIENPDSDAKLAGGEFAKLPQTKKCRILRTIEITARDEKQAQTIEAPLPPTKGVERMGVAVVRAGEGSTPTLLVEWIHAEGPLDTRHPFIRRWVRPGTEKLPPHELTRDVLSRFMPHAWRRPVAAEELDRVARIADSAIKRGDQWEAGMRAALVAILSSPKFVFRMEPDDQPDAPGAHPINEFQLATRLSYFLWASCPDDELHSLARAGKLAASIDAQIRRMLRDPRAETLTENFAMQWLQLRRIAQHQADDGAFRLWKPALKRSMIEETRLFFAEIVREDRSILDLIDSDFTYLNRHLGEIYGINPPGGYKGEEFKRVALGGTPRGGLLTHASILTVTSNPTRTSPVKRGKWILEQLLGDPPPPAPPAVPSIDDNTRKELSGTFRQKMIQHRADPKCATCHAKMDAIGFAMENFDGIGQWRDKDEQGRPLEIGDKIPGLEVRSFDGLKKYLLTRKTQFARCFTEKLLTYALGRGLEYYDDRSIDRITADLAANGYKFSALVKAIVTSDPFRLRRGKDQQ